MTYDGLLWVMGLTALLTAPAAIVLFALGRRLLTWFGRQLPPRHLVARGLRAVQHAEEEGPHD
ncbi:hypothetical protein [Aquipseudomonas alcaligenes]|uniref:hypothetical protein n=1 Tax=Aquipseudomonas alcaligenes TaxID=43263 RepID=UPI0037486901